MYNTTMKKLLKFLYSLLGLVLFAAVGVALGLRVAPQSGVGDSSSFRVSTTRAHDPLEIARAAIANAESSVLISTRMLDSDPIIRELHAARGRGVQIAILLTNPSVYSKSLSQSTRTRYQERFRAIRDSRIGDLYLTNVVNFVTFITIDGKVTINLSAPIDTGTYRSEDAYIGFDLHLSATAARAYNQLFSSLIADAAKAS